MSKKPTAAEQFAALGIDPVDHTPAMQLAIKQRWSGLEVERPVAHLRKLIESTVTVAVPTVAEILAAGEITDPEAAEAEHARLKRNAAVNAWRVRNQLQAALDARDLKFAALRAKRGSKVAVQPATDVA